MTIYETFSKPAAELVLLMGWVYGVDFKVWLMRACYQRSKSDKVNIATVHAILDEASEVLATA